MNRSSPVKWDKGKIVRALLDRQARGLELNIGAIQKQHLSLSAAIYSHFQSHDAALLAAGIDPASVRKAVRWDRARVITALQARVAAGLAVNVAAVARDERRLSGAMTGEQILAALQGLARNGLVARPWVESAHPRLRDQARRRFGFLQAAVEAAGLQYVPRCAGTDDVGHWTEQGVLKMLRDLHREGHDLRYRRMKEKSQPLFFAAKRLFGSYVNAVRQAGIDYWEMSQAQLANDRAAAAAGNARAEADG